MRVYRETFDDGPGGWFGYISNAAGPKPLEIRDSCAVSRSPWWIDYNHAPPGAGYLHLLYLLLTRGAAGEHQRDVSGANRCIAGGFGTNFTNAQITLRLKGKLLARGATLNFLCQGIHGGMCTGWMLTGQSLEVTADWSEQTIVCVRDVKQWTCLGSRYARADYDGRTPLATVLSDANTDILSVINGTIFRRAEGWCRGRCLAPTR